MSKTNLLVFAIFYCAFIVGCRLTLVVEPFLPPGVDVKTVIPDVESRTDLSADRGIDASSQTTNSYQLLVENWKVIYALPELNQERLGDDWIALGRPLAPPYGITTVITEVESSGWVVITPDAQLKEIKQIHIEDRSAQSGTMRTIDEVIVADDTDFAELQRRQSLWYEPTSRSVLRIAAVFVPKTQTMYNLIPSQLSSIAVAPFRLRCEEPDAVTNLSTCALNNRFDSEPAINYTGTFTITSPINLSFYTLVSGINTRADLGKCDEQLQTCTLEKFGQPDKEGLHDRVCIDILQCPNNPSLWCEIWVCQ